MILCTSALLSFEGPTLVPVADAKACHDTFLLQHLLMLPLLLQELELSVIGWADEIASLSDGSLAALEYRVSFQHACTC